MEIKKYSYQELEKLFKKVWTGTTIADYRFTGGQNQGESFTKGFNLGRELLLKELKIKDKTTQS